METFLSDIIHTYSSLPNHYNKLYCAWKKGGYLSVNPTDKITQHTAGLVFKTLGALTLRFSIYSFIAAMGASSLPLSITFAGLGAIGLIVGHDLGELGFAKADIELASINSAYEECRKYPSEICSEDHFDAVIVVNSLMRKHEVSTRNNEQVNALAKKLEEKGKVSNKDIQMIVLFDKYYNRIPHAYIAQLALGIHSFCLKADVYNKYFSNSISDLLLPVESKGKEPDPED